MNMSKRNPFPRRKRRGASVLEMCLVLPVLLMLSFGAADYGYFFFVKNTLQGAAGAGVRAAAPPTATNANVNTVISNMMTAAGLQSSGYTVTYSPSDVSTAAAGSPVSVTITITWGNVSMHALSAGYGGISNAKLVTGAAAMIKESS
ncbi:MAG TPA: TadE family protein [Tepidisphaeraceae bacterium]|jgi:Flp pilus assembly protein TadG